METIEQLSQPVVQEKVADADISAAIETLFLSSRGVSAHLIDVATQNGIVALTGFTDSLLSRQRAEEIALAVRGVRSVVNELEIRTPELPDADLRRDVERALAHDPATGDYNITCLVADGIVTVSGVLQTWLEKQLVLRVLRGVRGVRRIEGDNLKVRGGEIMNSDEEISTEIREILDWDIRVNSALVEVQTTDKVVHLAGTVGSGAEKEHIISVAYQAGARQVQAQDLFVAHWAVVGDLRRDKFAPRADADIAQAVRDTFRHDPRVRPAEPGVRVYHGYVTLTGTVSNLRARLDAEQDARHVVGVWDVQNRLKVRPPHDEPDSIIRQNIRDALARDPYVGDFDFMVLVRNGKVYLDGRVGNHFEQEHAADVAAGIGGVAEVVNRLEATGSTCATGVRPYGPPAWGLRPTLLPDPDYALAERIRRRHFWSASLYHQDVHVAVENGVALLTGTVDTWFDREQAGFEAYEAGARFVNNELKVHSPAHA
ncbi:BON domain-containing protein [Hymenobacter sp. DH14]|uniref:BON domain-containing protein n=1 Tax=Hymenobacter cyanobacteriorum TaxID=2926463 RepID=A0A9X1VG90_9BACT|nr:BON domain-containing protein [Hymenobacter cyanobacteriorum]MCI1188644.1 BON domain-containing protein [Hymenobacter cyanobacteriorum]